MQIKTQTPLSNKQKLAHSPAATPSCPHRKGKKQPEHNDIDVSGKVSKAKLEYLGIKGLVSFCCLGKEAIVYSTLLDMPFPNHALCIYA